MTTISNAIPGISRHPRLPDESRKRNQHCLEAWRQPRARYRHSAQEETTMTTDEQKTDTVGHANGPVSSPPPSEPTVLPPPPPPQQLIIPGQRLPYSNAQPVWQFILLNLCTLTLYQLVWIFRNWYLLKTKGLMRGNPVAYTIFIPLLSWNFFEGVKKLAGSYYTWPLGVAGPPVFATIYFLLIVFGRVFDRLDRTNDEISGLAYLAMLISFSAILPLIPAVHALNAYWANEQPDRPIRNSLSAGAIVTVIIGGILLLLVLLGLVMGITGQL